MWFVVDKVMNYYVAGFMFDTKGENVVLIRKQKPEWQKGRLNGIGGKVELSDLHFYESMTREFREETGVLTPEDDWVHFVDYFWEGGIVYFFFCKNDKYFNAAKTTEIEEVVKYPVQFVKLQANSVIYNLKWLIPLALDSSLNFKKNGPIEINE